MVWGGGGGAGVDEACVLTTGAWVVLRATGCRGLVGFGVVVVKLGVARAEVTTLVVLGGDEVRDCVFPILLLHPATSAIAASAAKNGICVRRERA